MPFHKLLSIGRSAAWLFVPLALARCVMIAMRFGSSGVESLPLQLSVGVANDIWVWAVFASLVTALYQGAAAVKTPATKRALRGTAQVLIGVLGLTTLGNLAFVSFNQANISPSELGYYRDLPNLVPSLFRNDNYVVKILSGISLLGLYFLSKIIDRQLRRKVQMMGAPWVFALILVLGVPFRSYSLSKRQVLHEPLETHILPYLSWRWELDRKFRLEKPTAGLQALEVYKNQIPVDAPLQPLGKSNVVLVLAESLGKIPLARNPSLIEPLRGLMERSVVLDRHVSSVQRTVGAQFSMLCARYEAQSFFVSRDYPRKKVSGCLPEALNSNGYTSLFYTGTQGTSDYNAEWLEVHGMSTRLTQKNFPSTLETSSYGVHDGPLFEKVFGDLSKQKGPFFAYVLTSSNHHPYKIPLDKAFWPMERIPDWPLDSDKTWHYAANQINDFIEKALKTEWGKNTLFVVVGDHNPWGDSGLSATDARTFDEILAHHSTVAFFHHPLLKPGRMAQMTSHVDIPTTILSLMGLSRPEQMLGASLDLRNTSRMDPQLESRWVLSQENDRTGQFAAFHAQEDALVQSAGGCRSLGLKSHEKESLSCKDNENKLLKELKSTFFDTTAWWVFKDPDGS